MSDRIGVAPLSVVKGAILDFFSAKLISAHLTLSNKLFTQWLVSNYNDASPNVKVGQLV